MKSRLYFCVCSSLLQLHQHLVHQSGKLCAFALGPDIFDFNNCPLSYRLGIYSSMWIYVAVFMANSRKNINKLHASDNYDGSKTCHYVEFYKRNIIKPILTVLTDILIWCSAGFVVPSKIFTFQKFYTYSNLCYMQINKEVIITQLYYQSLTATLEDKLCRSQECKVDYSCL